MTFTEALYHTKQGGIARPIGSRLRPGLGWFLEAGRVRWADPTLLQTLAQRERAVAPWPNEEELFSEREVTE